MNEIDGLIYTMQLLTNELIHYPIIYFLGIKKVSWAYIPCNL